MPGAVGSTGSGVTVTPPTMIRMSPPTALSPPPVFSLETNAAGLPPPGPRIVKFPPTVREMLPPRPPPLPELIAWIEPPAWISRFPSTTIVIGHALPGPDVLSQVMLPFGAVMTRSVMQGWKMPTVASQSSAELSSEAKVLGELIVRVPAA